MASINKRKVSAPVFTHEGAKASKTSSFQKLERTVLSCLLGENNFYEDGFSVEARIRELMLDTDKENCIKLLRRAKQDYHLRHVPLYMLCVLAEKRELSKELVVETITRADEITELLALYLKDGKKPLPKQMEKGIGLAFAKFDEYQLSKYKNNKKSVSLRDALRLCHAKPANEAQSALYKKLLNDELATPLTVETELSAGKDKKEVFTHLLDENRLGALALLRNMQNMKEAGVDSYKIAEAIKKMNVRGIMPYNFYSANLHSDGAYSKYLEEAAMKAAKDFDKLPGKTLFMVDTSGSMSARLSEKSNVTRAVAAASLAAIIAEVCDFAEVYTFDGEAHKQTYRGFALADICSKACGSTCLRKSTNQAVGDKAYDRLIIITDEQTSYYDGRFSEAVRAIPKKYIIDVGCCEHGIEYNKHYTHICGFSDGVFKYLANYEKLTE